MLVETFGVISKSKTLDLAFLAKRPIFKHLIDHVDS